MPLFTSRLSPRVSKHSTHVPRDHVATDYYHVGVSCQSVSLSCLAPDSLSMHTLSSKDGVITTRFLPLTSTSTMQQDPSTSNVAEKKYSIKSVKTMLPQYITDSFRVDPPLELICVDIFTAKSVHGDGNMQLPLLCAYSSKAAFVLNISYSVSENCRSQGEAQGCVDHVIEPFENHLLSSSQTSISILRIRSAPHSFFCGGGVYETLGPRGAMVMLTNESCLVVHHGVKEGSLSHKNLGTPSSNTILTAGNVTVPISFSVENIQEEDSFVDFVFLPSSPKGVNSVLNALSVVLTTCNGALFIASPILFHGAVLPKDDVASAISYLENELRTIGSNQAKDKSMEGAIWRRNRAALQYLVDAFGTPAQSSQCGYYVTASMLQGGTKNGTSWPVSLQGPFCRRDENLFEDQEEEDYEFVQVSNKVSCMEVISPIQSANNESEGASTSGVILTGGNQSNKFLYYVMFPSGICLIPRFAFESKYDADVLNAAISNSAAVVNKIILDESNENKNVKDDETGVEFSFDQFTGGRSFGRDIAIVIDPVDKKMIHHVSGSGVFTISSDTFQVIEQLLTRILIGEDVVPLTQESIRTNARPLVGLARNSNKNSDSVVTVTGVIVVGDAQLGHILFASLSNGATEALNLTAIHFLHEESSLSKGEEAVDLDPNALQDTGLTDIDEGLKALDSIPPLHELIAPLFSKLTAGLEGMGKIVGGTTATRDISPGALASFMTSKERCEKEIILPSLELSGLIKARLKYLDEMKTHQLLHISKLKEMIDDLNVRGKANREEIKAFDACSELLSKRSAAALSAVRKLVPCITDAEREYFNQLRRYESSCSKWNDLTEQMIARSRLIRERLSLCDAGSIYEVRLNAEQIRACFDLLEGGKVLLDRNAKVLQKCHTTVKSIVVETGITSSTDRTK